MGHLISAPVYNKISHIHWLYIGYEHQWQKGPAYISVITVHMQYTCMYSISNSLQDKKHQSIVPFSSIQVVVVVVISYRVDYTG